MRILEQITIKAFFVDFHRHLNTSLITGKIVLKFRILIFQNIVNILAYKYKEC